MVKQEIDNAFLMAKNQLKQVIDNQFQWPIIFVWSAMVKQMIEIAFKWPIIYDRVINGQASDRDVTFTFMLTYLHICMFVNYTVL